MSLELNQQGHAPYAVCGPQSNTSHMDVPYLSGIWQASWLRTNTQNTNGTTRLDYVLRNKETIRLST